MVTIVQSGPIEQSVRLARQLAVVAVRTLDRALLAGFEKLYVWQERARQRHQLAEMSAHMRADLGLSQADIDLESNKPFWIN
ncbi:MAG: DUF1127 domain-containing protein [Alphaproteobacteria bacterium]|nr:DUF1127 domain-containing protein [Alphaproteobacteria bacterium]